jgi:hypothetical protein
MVSARHTARPGIRSWHRPGRLELAGGIEQLQQPVQGPLICSGGLDPQVAQQRGQGKDPVPVPVDADDRPASRAWWCGCCPGGRSPVS